MLSTLSKRKKQSIIFSSVVGAAVLALTIGSSALQAEGRGDKGGWGFGGDQHDCRSGQHERGGRGHHQGKGGHGGMLGQLLHPKLIKSLDLSEEQMAQIKSLMEESRAAHEAEREANKAAHQAALESALQQDAVTAEALMALSDQRGENHKQARADMIAEVLNILTPDQRLELLKRVELVRQ